MTDNSKEFQMEETIFKSEKIYENQLFRWDSNISKEFDEQQLLINDLVTDFKELFEKIEMLIGICTDLKSSIEVDLKNKKGNKQQEFNQYQKNQKAQQDSYKPFIYHTIKKLEISDEIQCYRVANKLKILVSKVCHEKNSSIRYNFISYVDWLLNDFKRNDNNNSENILSINKILLEIKNKFNVSTQSQVLLYRRHPTNYIHYSRVQLLKVVFYINLYNQSLLFFRDQIVPKTNSNLLFCPIELQLKTQLPQQNKLKQPRQTVTISGWYLNQLCQSNLLWHSYSLLIFIKTPVKSYNKPKQLMTYFGRCSVAKLGRKIDEQNNIIGMLRKIRRYVYLQMVMRWLCYVLQPENNINSQTTKELTITLDCQTSVIITTRQISGNQFDKFYEQPKIIQDFLSYFSQQKIKRRKEKSRQDVLSNIKTHLLSILKTIQFHEQFSKKDDINESEKSQNIPVSKQFHGSFKYMYINGAKILL